MPKALQPLESVGFFYKCASKMFLILIELPPSKQDFIYNNGFSSLEYSLFLEN